MPELPLRIRPTIEADLPALFEHQADLQAAEMAAVPSKDWDAFQAHWVRIKADPANLHHSITLKGEVVGKVMSFFRDGEREVGYWIAREHWGKGIATLAMKELLLIDTHRPLIGVVEKHNLASQRVLEKAGFARIREEGEVVVLRLGVVE